VVEVVVVLEVVALELVVVVAEVVVPLLLLAPPVVVPLEVVVAPPDEVPCVTPRMLLQATSADAQAREASVR
jgi:cytochrome c oxidase assembly factor CtaG